MSDIIDRAKEMPSSLNDACRTIETMADEIERLRAQLERAREALEPFAAVAEHDIGNSETNADIFRPMRGHNRARQLTVGDLRAAASALTDEKGTS